MRLIQNMCTIAEYPAPGSAAAADHCPGAAGRRLVKIAVVGASGVGKTGECRREAVPGAAGPGGGAALGTDPARPAPSADGEMDPRPAPSPAPATAGVPVGVREPLAGGLGAARRGGHAFPRRRPPGPGGRVRASLPSARR